MPGRVEMYILWKGVFMNEFIQFTKDLSTCLKCIGNMLVEDASEAWKTIKEETRAAADVAQEMLNERKK